jgi:hypothetical protein
MRKSPLIQESTNRPRSETDWLALDDVSAVEITSEDPAYPIESALLPGRDSEWRAATPGRQMIRLRFDLPQRLSRIALEFNEQGVARTQQYVLRWSDDDGKSFHEIARQQWNFNPDTATRETEDHRVELPGVTILDLIVDPDISGGHVRASLARLRVA